MGSLLVLGGGEVDHRSDQILYFLKWGFATPFHTSQNCAHLHAKSEYLPLERAALTGRLTARHSTVMAAQPPRLRSISDLPPRRAVSSGASTSMPASRLPSGWLSRLGCITRGLTSDGSPPW